MMYNRVSKANTPKLRLIARRVLTNVRKITMATSDYTSKDIERFWSKDILKADSELCWEWTGSCDSSGYGTIRVNKSTHSTHRTAWRITYGTIPSGMYICHKCDNPKCVNPNHLWIGTSQDNSLDRARKGRGPTR